MTILYQNGAFDVRAEKFGKTDGFAVYENGPTAAHRVASIGFSGDAGLRRAIIEADRRAA